ncbi:MAG TPA: hypothetical protein VHE99_02035 [Gammaproteobacteria bacterium]|nr:hypothetical protein [Gammaproteobacteria bacterium]
MDNKILQTSHHNPNPKGSMIYKILITLMLLILPTSIFATWSAEIASGVVYNLPVPLTIQQMGEPDIHMTAHYETRPFTSPYYYDLRIGKWNGDTAWEFENIHQKIYLKNTTDEVSHFSISHGYNLITINRAWLNKHKYIWRVGLGLVIAHPESTIRGQTNDDNSGGTLNDAGYYVAGPTAMVSLGKRFYVSKSLFMELEGKVTASYAEVNVVNGTAYAPNVALHANFGLGYDF